MSGASCVSHTGARNSRNRVLTSSTGELSRYAGDDPRGAQAVWKIDVIGVELDDGSTRNSLTTGATSLASALRAPSAVA